MALGNVLKSNTTTAADTHASFVTDESENKKEVEALKPSISLSNRLKAIFGDDPKITTQFTEGENGKNDKLTLTVSDAQKFIGLKKLLPSCYEDEKLDIEIVEDVPMNLDLLEAAFKGNPHFKQTVEVTDPVTGYTYHICVFNSEVIKFHNDNFGSLHGYEFRLMQDLAQDLLDQQVVIYTTDDGEPIDLEKIKIKLENK